MRLAPDTLSISGWDSSLNSGQARPIVDAPPHPELPGFFHLTAITAFSTLRPALEPPRRAVRALSSSYGPTHTTTRPRELYPTREQEIAAILGCEPER
jgi:hypothetical protein